MTLALHLDIKPTGYYVTIYVPFSLRIFGVKVDQSTISWDDWFSSCPLDPFLWDFQQLVRHIAWPISDFCLSWWGNLLILFCSGRLFFMLSLRMLLCLHLTLRWAYYFFHLILVTLLNRLELLYSLVKVIQIGMQIQQLFADFNHSLVFGWRLFGKNYELCVDLKQLALDWFDFYL